MAKYYLWIWIISCCAITNVSAQSTSQLSSVQIVASTNQSPASITIRWQKLSGATSYEVYRKTKDQVSFGMAVATLPPADSSYTDNTVNADSAYEYQVIKSGTPVSGSGYIYASVKAMPIHNRGSFLLLVDSTFKDSCATEITTLMRDLRGDGWKVIMKVFARSETVSNIKNYVVSTYNADNSLKAVYILGHLAVPYSGDINPDGHGDHKGAWPADVFYGDVNGIWTDASVNNTTSTGTRNDNTPSDGKYDQSVLPTDAELQTGRVDVFNMPAFGKTEVQMMRSYLAKAHKYKMDSLTVIKRGLVDDNFTTGYSEPFAASGWRNFAPLVGHNNTLAGDYVTELNTASYQWTYGCGAGSYTSCSGVGNTTNIAANNMNGIFSMTFGSYFGDWDNQNNFLRAPLCANTPMLTNCWAGRPHWYFHHMALGENIGYSALLSQNNSNTYATPNNFASRFVHNALMGDPSLRTEYVKGVSNVTLTPVSGAGARITWTASAEPSVIGYYVYSADEEYGYYKRRSPLVNVTNYTDSYGTDGMKYYMVRAVKVQNTPSGNYHNMSIGVVSAPATIQYPKPELGIGNTINAGVTAIAYPNPANNTLYVNINTPVTDIAKIIITDITGRVLQTSQTRLEHGENQWHCDVSSYSVGMYYLTIQQKQGQTTLKWMKN